MEQRQFDFVVQFWFENWIIKSFCLCSTTDGIFLRNPYPWRRRKPLFCCSICCKFWLILGGFTVLFITVPLPEWRRGYRRAVDADEGQPSQREQFVSADPILLNIDVVVSVDLARVGEGEGDGGAGIVAFKVDGVEGEGRVDCAGVETKNMSIF